MDELKILLKPNASRTRVSRKVNLPFDEWMSNDTLTYVTGTLSYVDLEGKYTHTVAFLKAFGLTHAEGNITASRTPGSGRRCQLCIRF